ncbi:MAG: DUF4126 domain-containing protein [bacterium]
MDVVFTSIYARACMGAGLAVLTGMRAFLPVGFLALYSRLEFASAPILDGTPFAFLEKTWVIALLLALAVIELAVDKMPALVQTRDQVMRPIKIILGGLVFAAAMAPDDWIAMTVSGVLGLVIAGLADRARRSMRPDAGANTGPIVLMSIYEDLAVLVGTLLFVLVPLVGALLAFFLFLITYRLQQRRKRKHKGLRILKG